MDMEELQPVKAKTLQEAFGFTDEDLAANRSGMMSSQQVEKWRARAEAGKMMRPFAIALAIFIVLVTVGGLGYMILYLMQLGGGAAQFGIPIVLLVVLIVGVITVVGYIRTRPIGDQLLAGTAPVKRFTGEVKLVTTSRGRYGEKLVDLKIGRMTVMSNTRVYMPFEKGRKYHLYGLVMPPNVLMLLSAEPAE